MSAGLRPLDLLPAIGQRHTVMGNASHASHRFLYSDALVRRAPA